MTLAYLALLVCIKPAPRHIARLLSAMASQMFVVVSLDRLCADTHGYANEPGCLYRDHRCVGDSRAVGEKSHGYLTFLRISNNS